MENLGFLIFIIFIFLLQAIGQILTQKQKKRGSSQEESPKEQTLEDILESMGLPMPEREPLPPDEVFQEKEDPNIRKLKPTEIKEERELEKKEVTIKPQREEILLYNNLEDAVIYSAIIGPPKSQKFCRGVGTGIRSGLKNRCP